MTLKIVCGAAAWLTLLAAPAIASPTPTPTPTAPAAIIGCGANVSATVVPGGSAAWTFTGAQGSVVFATCDTTADTVLSVDGREYDDGTNSCGTAGHNERVVVAAAAQAMAGSLPVLVRYYNSSQAGTLRLSVTCATVPPTASPTTRAPTASPTTTMLGNTFAPTATPTGTIPPPTQPLHTHGRALFHSLLAPLPQTPSNHASPTPPCAPFPLYTMTTSHPHWADA